MITKECFGCEKVTSHEHLHDCAPGIPETHMVGSERFVCVLCKHVTFAGSDGASRFPFTFDRPHYNVASAHATTRVHHAARRSEKGLHHPSWQRGLLVSLPKRVGARRILRGGPTRNGIRAFTRNSKGTTAKVRAAI
jgi:hypothetical protein